MVDAVCVGYPNVSNLEGGNSVVPDYLSLPFQRGLACICFGDFVLSTEEIFCQDL